MMFSKRLLFSCLLSFLVITSASAQTASTNPSMPNASSSSSTDSTIPPTPSATDLLRAAAMANSNNTSASNQNNGPTCTPQGVAFQNKQAILNTGAANTQRIFLIHNATNYIVLVNHQVTPDPGVSAGWGSRLDPGKYSAIAMNQANFALTCMAFNPPQFGVSDCRSSLDICSYPVQKNNIGSYWVAENMTLDQVQKTMQQRNVMPK